MLTEADEASVIDPEVRKRIIESIIGETPILAEVRSRLRAAGLPRVPHRVLPPELWGIVPLIVPAENEGSTALIDSNETTITEFGEDAVPDLMAVDYVRLNETQAQHYSAFITAYVSYLQDYLQDLDTRRDELDFRRDSIVRLLPSYYRDDVSKGDRTRLANSDPFVRLLDTEISILKAESEVLRAKITPLFKRVHQISRDLERRKMQWEVERAGGFGTGASRKETPQAPVRQAYAERSRK